VIRVAIIAAVLAAFAVYSALIYETGKDTGVLETRAEYQRVIDESLSSQAAFYDEWVPKQQKKEVVYRDRVRTIYTEKDTTGCADVDVPQWMLTSSESTRLDRPATD